jgi:predicted CXXCH cytochrome family protein
MIDRSRRKISINRSNGALGWALTFSLCAVFVCTTGACAPDTRYRVLSFFFDGVPAPGEQPKLPESRTRPETALFHPLRAGAQAPLPTVKAPASIHPPVRERKCGACHDPSDVSAPLALDERLCDKCHKEQRQREGWDHGPINLGTCIPCHRAHESPYPHLLEKPVPDLCLDCHREDMERKEDYHNVVNVDKCAECHDPHRMY